MSDVQQCTLHRLLDENARFALVYMESRFSRQACGEAGVDAGSQGHGEMNKSSLILALLAFPLLAKADADVLAVCDLRGGPTSRVEVIREAPIADTHVYLLRQNGKATPIFFDVDSSRGASVSAVCVGRTNRALVVSGEFTANAVQGFVLTYKPANQKVGRLDFAEKSRPKWLFLSKNDAIVVIPTHGLGETSKKFVAYRTKKGRIDTVAGEGIDQLPNAKGYEKIDLDAATKR